MIWFLSLVFLKCGGFLDMDGNYLVWGEVEALVSAYKLVDGEGNVSTDFESQEVARRMLKALIKYFSDNNLLVEGRGGGFCWWSLL